MSKLRDFAPILIVICCAAVFGTLLMTGVIDLNSIPTLVEHRPVLAVCVVLLFFIAASVVNAISGTSRFDTGQIMKLLTTTLGFTALYAVLDYFLV